MEVIFDIFIDNDSYTMYNRRCQLKGDRNANIRLTV